MIQNWGYFRQNGVIFLNWQDKSWFQEDTEFTPKRKIGNLIGWKRLSVTGSFYSNKMGRTVEYQSLEESLFYYFLELDTDTIRYYYVHPI